MDRFDRYWTFQPEMFYGFQQFVKEFCEPINYTGRVIFRHDSETDSWSALRRDLPGDTWRKVWA